MDGDMKKVGRSGEIKMNKNLKLGRGAFGSVYRGHHKTHGSCAVKRIEIDEKNELASKNFSKELDIIKSSSHPNMVRYLFDDEDENFYYITMELCTMSLSDYFRNHGFDAFENDMIVTRIMYQCTSGVEYLHGKNIMHKDIKPANMLLSESSNLITLKLADFGMCKVLDPNKSSTVSSTKGSLGYNAPEVVLGLRNKCQSDIFSLGIVLHELSTKEKHPFSKSDRLEAELNIKQKKLPDLNRVAETPFYLLITEMLYHNWDRRPNATQVLASLTKVVGTAGDHHKLGEPIKRSVFFGSGRSTSSTNKEREKVPDPQPGEEIASSVPFREKINAGDESIDFLKKDAVQAEYPLKYTTPALPSLKAVPVMPMDKNESLSLKKRKDETQVQQKQQTTPATSSNEMFLPPAPPTKRRKNEARENKDGSGTKKTTKTTIEKLVENYTVPRKKRTSNTLESQLKNAEFSIRNGKWQEAIDALDCGWKLLRSEILIDAQFLLDQAEKAESKFLYVMSILLYSCSASQFQNEGSDSNAAFKISECVFKIYTVTMNALRPKKTDRKELVGMKVRFKDIAQDFVIPLVTIECENLRKFCESKMLEVFDAAKHNAYAVSWFSVLLNYCNNFTEASKIAETARKEIEPYSSRVYQTYSRLLQQEGEAKKQLEEYDEAADLLNRALEITNKYEKDEEKRNTNIHFINRAIEDNVAKRTKKFASAGQEKQ